MDLPAAAELGRRGAAGALLGCGSAVGWRCGGLPTRRVAAVALGFALPGMAALSLAARRAIIAGAASRQTVLPSFARPAAADPGAADPARATDDAGLPITILVPARDEVAHIPELLRDLGRQELVTSGEPLRLRVVVIDDRSADGTGAAAKAAIREAGLDGRVSRRDGPGGAKGDALRHVPVEVTADSRLIVVLDADARVAPDFVRRVAACSPAGAAAFTVRRHILGADRSRLAQVQDDEQALDAWILAGRTGLGGAGELRGNGMVLTPEALAAAGGWPTGVLTEDLELSTALLTAGIRVAWEGAAEVEETAAGTLAAIARQRLRWSEGSARRFLAQLPRALASRRATRAARLDLALYAGQLVLPPVVVGAAARAIASGRPGPLGALVGVYVVAGSLLAWDAIGALQRRVDPGPRVVRALAVGLFSAHWLVVLPASLARIALGPGTVTFRPTRDRLTPRPEMPRDRHTGMNGSRSDRGAGTAGRAAAGA